MRKQVSLRVTLAFYVIALPFCVTGQTIVETKLTPSDGRPGDHFGVSVGISGDYAIVGAPIHDNMSSQGSAYIFKRDEVSWLEQATLAASVAGDRLFGIHVAISGDHAIVGTGGTNRSGAYIFKRDGVSWVEQARITVMNARSDGFGSPVSISGDFAIVAATRNNDKGHHSGSAYLFQREGRNWMEQSKFIASDGGSDDMLGHSVSISGDYAIVGTFRFTQAAYIFKRNGMSWMEQTKLTPSDHIQASWFGERVSISSDYAIVGAGKDDPACYIFKRDGVSWIEQAKLTASDGQPRDDFGRSVSISEDYVIIGAPGQSVPPAFMGSAYIFRRVGSSWEQTKLVATDGRPDDTFGSSVSISADYAIVGAHHDDDNGNDSGSAYIYSGFSKPVGVEDEILSIPIVFSLGQNYPNPFNPITTISYELSTVGHVELTVYNLLGQKIRTLVDERQLAGAYGIQWDGTNDEGIGVPSGVYLYRMTAGSFNHARKMALLR